MPFVYAVAGLLACWAVGPADLPVVADNQHYFFIAERFASGVPPHVSHFDPKNALSMMITGWAIMLGRAVGVADLYAARAASIAAAAVCVGLVWTVTRRYSRSVAAAHVAALSMLTFNQFFIMAAVGARPKVFMELFVILTLMAVERRRAFASALWAAAAFLCWQPALMMGAPVPVTMLFWKRRLRSILIFLAVFGAAVLCYEAYFFAQGALDQQIEQAYRFPSQYMSGLTLKQPAVVARFRWITKTFEGASAKSIVPLATLALSVLALAWALLRPFATVAFVRRRPEWLYFTVVGVGGLAFLHLDYQGFPDRFLIEPFLAITFGTTVCLPSLAAPARPLWRRVGACAAAAAAASCLYTLAQVDWQEYRGPVLPRQYEVAARVGAMLDAGKSVYAVGCTHLLAFNHVNNWVKYGFFFRGMTDYTEARYGRPYVPYRNDELPDVILLSRGRSSGLVSWLPRRYRQLDNSVLGTHSVSLWVKRFEPLERVPVSEYGDLLRRPRASSATAASGGATASQSR
jgi:hypothetical protein